MRPHRKPTLLMILVSILFLGSCTKEGPPGPAGANGSANVTSRIFNINTWYTTTVPYKHYFVDLSMPELNSATINSAAVMVYINTGGAVWTAIPYTEYNFPSDYHMGFRTDIGIVELTWFYDGSGYGYDPNTQYGVIVQSKVVIIPATALQAHPEVDIKNYEQVKNTFGLQN